ncbi:MAG: EamA family transporter [Candidatus Pacebacteria bacterium]|nr:EamA family transporter [Candidatus Paceibacterota bacterium]
MAFNPHLEVVLAAIIWGSTGAFVKYLDLPPTTMSFFRLAIPSIILFFFLSTKKVFLFKGNNKLILFASSLNVVRMFLYFTGFSLASIANAVIIWFTFPIFVLLIEITILKEKISKRQSLLILIAFLGIIFMYIDKNLSFSSNDFIGMSAMLFASMMNAILIIIYKKVSNKYSKAELIFYQNIIGAFIFLPFIFFMTPLPSISQIGVATIYAILIGVVGFGLFFSALKRIKASVASYLSYIEVLSAITIAIILFNENLTWNIIIGGILIIVSAALLETKKDNQNVKTSTKEELGSYI